VRWAGHVVRLEAMKNAFTVLIRRNEEKRHLTDLGVDGMIILGWNLGKQGG